MAPKTAFKAEIKELMSLITHSMYSDQEVFLRELVSNGSDALEKERIRRIKSAGSEGDLLIYVDVDSDARTITVRDTGIGMSMDEVSENLGTIAKSGTKALLEQLKKADSKEKNQMIGQFGVGFYSSFVVADKVVVRTLKAGEEKGVEWTSDGVENYTTKSIKMDNPGTEVVLHLREDEGLDKFLQDWQVKQIVTNWSNHILFPIMMKNIPEEGKEPEYEQINDTQAIWTMRPKDVSDEDYQKFYQSLTHDMHPAMTYDHKHVEGTNLDFTTLLFVPKEPPMDLYFRDYSKKGLKLYVQRVFIMDEAEQFLPSYLRFVKGVIDSSDLPLNVSREILQANPKTKSMKTSCTKAILKMLAKLAKDRPDDYQSFWKNFGPVLKEGAAQDFANRDQIVKLLRFSSTKNDQVSLDGYIESMKKDQEKIYYLIAENEKTAQHSPHLEQYESKGYEVLLMTDRVDPFMMNSLKEYEGKTLHNVSDQDESMKDNKLEKAAEEAQKEHESDLERVQKSLGDKVSEVRFTSRLVTAPSSVVAGKDELTPHMHRILKDAGQPVPDFKPVLELNPKHLLVLKLLAEESDEQFALITEVLFDQAVLSEGGQVDDPNKFIRSMNELIS